MHAEPVATVVRPSLLRHLLRERLLQIDSPPRDRGRAQPTPICFLRTRDACLSFLRPVLLLAILNQRVSFGKTAGFLARLRTDRSWPAVDLVAVWLISPGTNLADTTGIIQGVE